MVLGLRVKGRHAKSSPRVREGQELTVRIVQIQGFDVCLVNWTEIYPALVDVLMLLCQVIHVLPSAVHMAFGLVNGHFEEVDGQAGSSR